MARIVRGRKSLLVLAAAAAAAAAFAGSADPAGTYTVTVTATTDGTTEQTIGANEGCVRFKKGTPAEDQRKRNPFFTELYAVLARLLRDSSHPFSLP